jgi:hypothetical protein
MTIKYVNIEFDTISELIAYQKTFGVAGPAKIEPVTKNVPAQNVEETVKEFYKENVGKKYLGHGKRKELADKLGVPSTRLQYILKKLKKEGNALPISKARTKRAPNRYKSWTQQDDKQLLSVAKKYMNQEGSLEYGATGKIAKEVGRTKGAVSNRIFYLSQEKK